jgi:hypothetical protein
VYDLQTKITFTGLKGIADSGERIPVALPETGESVPLIVSHPDVLEQTGEWNREDGTLVVRVLADSVAGVDYNVIFTVTNPATKQNCAVVTMSIEQMCFPSYVMQNAVADLPSQGTCSGISQTPISTSPFPALINDKISALSQGSCALRVVEPKIVLAYAFQSSEYPCMPTDISVRLVSNVPVEICQPSVTITGLTGVMQASGQINVRVGQDTVQGVFDESSGQLTVPSAAMANLASGWTACEHIDFEFTLTNQVAPRSRAPLSVRVNGDLYSFALPPENVKTPSTSTEIIFAHLSWARGKT